MILHKGINNSSLKVGIDLRMVCHSGIGRFLQNLIPAMIKQATYPIDWVFIGNSLLLSKEFLSLPPNVSFYEWSYPIYGMGEQLFSNRLNNIKLDVLHCPHYNIPLRFNGRLIVTIHDLIHIKYPKSVTNPLGRFYAQWLILNSINKADQLVTDSKTVHDEVIHFCPSAKNKTTVILPGIPMFKDISTIPPLINSPFILFVGINKPHKNISVLLKSFAQIQNKYPELKLVIVGNRWKEINSIKNIILLENSTDPQLIWLYRNAKMLIHPSKSEGFGFTPLEALSQGCPVIVSDIPVFRNNLEDSVEYFNLNNPSELSTKIEEILNNPDARTYCIQKYNHLAPKFNWDDTAAGYLELYQKQGNLNAN